MDKAITNVLSRLLRMQAVRQYSRSDEEVATVSRPRPEPEILQLRRYHQAVIDNHSIKIKSIRSQLVDLELKMLIEVTESYRLVSRARGVRPLIGRPAVV